MRKQSVRYATTLAALCYPAVSFAEGTTELGVTQALRAGTVLNVDVLTPGESIVWTGRGNVAVKAPSGATLSTASSGQVIAASAGAGKYSLVVAQDQFAGASWDVTVSGSSPQTGRLSSKNWMFNAGSFAASAATNASFYALVDGGSPTDTSVIELELNGLAGYIYDINANRMGVDGPLAGRSVPEAGNSVTPEFPIYLNPPAVATYTVRTPGVSGLTYVGGVDTSVTGDPLTPCDYIPPSQGTGYFSFSSTVTGTYQLQCDLDQDGSFSVSSGLDLLRVGNATSGMNVVAWDGLSNGGSIDPGQYQCRVRIAVGEFHYVGRDIETSYPGLRLFRVNQDGSRTGLSMFWNDSLIQSAEVAMPNGQLGLVSSEGEAASGDYAAAATANVSAHSWGNFTGAGKGNVNYVDTYVWLDEETSDTLTLRAPGNVDGDGDGLSDYQERCQIGSDPDVSDTDGDGVPDGQQYVVSQSSAFSGLESNGKMGAALARRAMRRAKMSVAPLRLSALSGGEMSPWLPTDMDGLGGVVNSPEDLIGLTNAKHVIGADYLDTEGERRGGVLMVSADGAFYEHQKNICDRVRQEQLLDVTPRTINGTTVFLTTLRGERTGRFEYGASLSLWRNSESDAWNAVAFWLSDNAPELGSNSSTITIQAWGDDPAFAMNALSATLLKIEEDAPIAWPSQQVPREDETYEIDEVDVAEQVAPEAPSSWVEKLSAVGSKVTLDIKRRSGSGDVQVRFVGLADDGETEFVVEEDGVAAAAPRVNSYSLPAFIEVTAEVRDAGKLVDRVWISDGAWAPYDNQVWVGEASSAQFSKSGCELRDIESSGLVEGRLDESDVHLAGCAKVEYAQAMATAGLARHLMVPIDIGSFQSLAYFVRSSHPYDLCLENDGSRECVAMPEQPDGAWEALSTEAFADSGEQTGLVLFVAKDAGVEMEVQGLHLLTTKVADTRPTVSAEQSGCSVSARKQAAGLGWGMALIGLCAVAAKRRRR